MDCFPCPVTDSASCCGIQYTQNVIVFTTTNRVINLYFTLCVWFLCVFIFLIFFRRDSSHLRLGVMDGCRCGEKVEGIRFCAVGSGLARGEGALGSRLRLGRGLQAKKAGYVPAEQKGRGVVVIGILDI